MNIKNMRISLQLKVGFAVILLFVILLGVASYIHMDEIHQQLEDMYEHPLQVRRAIGHLGNDIYAIHRDMKDLLLAADEKEIALDLDQIENWKANAFDQIDILYSRYLGPRIDIDLLKQAFVTWNSTREETIRLLRAGKTQEAINRTKASGVGGAQAEVLLAALRKVDDFARKKGDSLYAYSTELKDSLNRQLILLVAAILLFSAIIIYVVSRNMRKPLNELTAVARRFHEGDMDARSSYDLHNEFGVLSDSFNMMADGIQKKNDLDGKVADLAALMLSEYDANKFFRATLDALATHTGSQMAAIYMLSDDRKTFDHFQSTGVDDNARQSFSAVSFEGEFGSAISSRKVQWIKNIPQDTRFVFHTVSGKFIPREIITIPILADNAVVAIISLASVNAYSNQSVHLIDRILVTLCARVEGIMAYHKIKEILGKLEVQNRELEAQKVELASQSAELTEQNAELEMQKNQLGEANRLKGNFLANMSHELRTPLNSVIALSGVLTRRLAKQIPEEEHSYLEVIERNGKHLLSLINDILDISRIEAGREEIEITEFNPDSLISELVSMIQPQAKQKNIELLQIETDPDLFISSDAHKCRHILQNIIGNAVKFTEDGKVEVTSSRSDGRILITVTDTGIGIADEHIAHIFDEFRQADSSTSRRFGGTGLGLAIAKKYANLLGGTVSVKSIPGTGSEFTLTLPLRYAAENRVVEGRQLRIGESENRRIGVGEAGREDKDCQQVATERHQLGGIDWRVAGRKDEGCQQFAGGPIRNASTVKTILLVDDSEPAVIQIKDFLEESGYHVLVARNGGEALGIIAKTIPDAMILDLMMPGIDGFEVLQTIREAERTAHIPVLILTAKHISKEDLMFLKRNNIHQLIQKGDVKRDELLDAVTQMTFTEKEEAVKPVRKPQTIEGKPLVLVVEDNVDNMLTVSAILADDYSVIEAVDGHEAVEMAKKHKPHLVLMDIELPGMDGIAAFKAIRNSAELQHVPVIALTASAMVSDREEILAYGFDAYIAKPIDAKIFFKTINEVLGVE